MSRRSADPGPVRSRCTSTICVANNWRRYGPSRIASVSARPTAVTAPKRSGSSINGCPNTRRRPSRCASHSRDRLPLRTRRGHDGRPGVLPTALPVSSTRTVASRSLDAARSTFPSCMPSSGTAISACSTPAALADQHGQIDQLHLTSPAMMRATTKQTRRSLERGLDHDPQPQTATRQHQPPAHQAGPPTARTCA